MHKILIGALSTAAAVMLSGCATTALTQAEVDARVDQFTTEHLGLKIGDPSAEKPGIRAVQLKKQFLDFNVAQAETYNGKIVRMQLSADVNKSVGKKSANAKMREELSQLAIALGLDPEYFSRHRVFTLKERNSYLPDWYRDDGKTCPSHIIYLIALDLAEAQINKDDCWRYVVEIRSTDWRLHAR